MGCWLLFPPSEVLINVENHGAKLFWVPYKPLCISYKPLIRIRGWFGGFLMSLAALQTGALLVVEKSTDVEVSQLQLFYLLRGMNHVSPSITPIRSAVYPKLSINIYKSINRSSAWVIQPSFLAS
jgi:hypothetical protein